MVLLDKLWHRFCENMAEVIPVSTEWSGRKPLSFCVEPRPMMFWWRLAVMTSVSLAARLIMTRVAGVSCAVLPIEAAGIPQFRLWLDCSYGVYLWEALYEIVRDHGGEVVGHWQCFPVTF